MSLLRSLHRHRATRVVARWALGIGLVAVLVIGLDTGEVWNRIASANPALVVIGIAGLVGVHALGAAAWRMLCRRLGGLNLGWGTSLRIHYAAQALGGITPANLGGDTYRVLAVRSAGLGWSAAVAPVVVQRATSYLALALLAAPSLAWLAATSEIPAPLLLGGLLLSGAAAALSIVLLIAPGRLGSLGTRLASSAPERPGDQPAGASGPARVSRSSIAVGTGLGIAFHAAAVLFTVLLLVAVDPSAMTVGVVAAVVVARLSLAIPILPSGLGANEMILSLLATGLGVSPETALAGLLLGRVALVCTTLLGAALIAFGRHAVTISPPTGAGVEGAAVQRA